MHIITITTSFPATHKSYPVFILKTLNGINAEHDIIVPKDNCLQYDNLFKNGRVHWVRYAPRKWSLITSSMGGGGIPVNIKNHPWLILLYPQMMLALLFKTLQLTRKDSIIHAHWLPNGLIAVFIKKIKNVPLVITIRGADQKFLRAPLLRIITRWILSNADAITTVSKTFADEISNKFGASDKIYFIPNGVDIPESVQKVDRNILKLLFVGSLIPRKGVHILIDAMARLKTKRNILLNIIGEGPEKENLTRQVNENEQNGKIHFLGNLAPEDVQKYMLERDCLILPSYMEGTPNVVKEAMACGLPVIATNVGGIPELVTHGEQGLLFEPGDVETLVKHINYILENPEKASEMGRKGRQFIIEKGFTWKNTAKQYTEIYKDNIYDQRKNN